MTTQRADSRKRAEERIRVIEERREVVRDALAAVYSGAGFLEADAFLDALGDLDASVRVGAS